MAKFRRFSILAATVAVVLGMGAVGLALSQRAQSKAQAIHRGDRETLQNTLASLSNQYIQFAFKDEFDFISTRAWSLKPNDPADVAAIRAFTARSALLNYGGAMVSLVAQPIDEYSAKPGLPPATDPGYGPLRAMLLGGKPGLSSVMNVNGVPVVGLGVPLLRNGNPVAVYVGYFRADRTPLETYNARLRYGKTGISYLVDSQGDIASSADLSSVGTKLVAPAALEAIAAGKSGFLRFTRSGVEYVASYTPVGLGGWGAITTQTAQEFFGPIRSGALRVQVALVLLLALAAGGLAYLNHKRQSALTKAYEYKGQLLANTTHELKTPLTAIRGAAMTLGMRWRDLQPEQVDQFLGIIHRRCDALGKLIERILMGARLEAGREISVHLVPTDVTGTLRRITTEFGDASAKHQIVLDAPENLWASADVEALDQILGLLVENAIKYSPEGGEIRVEGRGYNGSVLVNVVDHGIGIGAEDRAHVFEPYFKASRGDTQRFAGVGLGLAIARHLVRAQGGDMKVESETGEGSTFSFTLPRVEAPAQTVNLVEAER